ncbi:unnamed protein product [Phyllotreta striolata]|uniref:Uncharacterized protein n=1 Tax=Phyllotreta striolata TaxID=444603 RepID=A0A9N9TRH1_PHYSR|nr:unnamed protein product [Phyllotreta striolata]
MFSEYNEQGESKVEYNLFKTIGLPKGEKLNQTPKEEKDINVEVLFRKSNIEDGFKVNLQKIICLALQPTQTRLNDNSKCSSLLYLPEKYQLRRLHSEKSAQGAKSYHEAFAEEKEKSNVIPVLKTISAQSICFEQEIEPIETKAQESFTSKGTFTATPKIINSSIIDFIENLNCIYHIKTKQSKSQNIKNIFSKIVKLHKPFKTRCFKYNCPYIIEEEVDVNQNYFSNACTCNKRNPGDFIEPYLKEQRIIRCFRSTCPNWHEHIETKLRNEDSKFSLKRCKRTLLDINQKLSFMQKSECILTKCKGCVDNYHKLFSSVEAFLAKKKSAFTQTSNKEWECKESNCPSANFTQSNSLGFYKNCSLETMKSKRKIKDQECACDTSDFTSEATQQASLDDTEKPKKHVSINVSRDNASKQTSIRSPLIVRKCNKNFICIEPGEFRYVNKNMSVDYGRDIIITIYPNKKDRGCIT